MRNFKTIMISDANASRNDVEHNATLSIFLQAFGGVLSTDEAIELYKQGNRPELAQKEQEEIAVIESFLPKQMSEAEAEQAIKAVIASTGAQSVKDMGRVMAALKEKY